MKLLFFGNLGGELSQMPQKMTCEKFGCKRKSSWLGFCLAKFDVLAFLSLVAKLVNK